MSSDMAIYKKDNKYIVKVCINGKQILRRKYLGREIVTRQQATDCEKDLYLQYSERLKDYDLDSLFSIYEEYLFKRFKETTAKRYLDCFNLHIKKYFVNKKISSLSRAYLEFVNDSLNNVYYKDVKHLIYIAKEFLKFLSGYGFNLNIGFMFCFRNNKLRPDEKVFYSFEEYKKFRSVINDKKDLLMFDLLFFYGLRVGELRGICFNDIFKDRIRINKELTNKGRLGGQKLLSTKTASSCREYPIMNIIKKDLDNIDSKKGFVFSGRDGVIGETTIRRKILDYSTMAGVKYVSPHGFRHSCVTYLISLGLDTNDIAHWVGHSSDRVTKEVYSHYLPLKKDRIKNAIDTIDTIF